MTLLAWIIIFTLFGGVLSVVAAGAFLLIPEAWRHRVLPAMVSYAIGALLGAAFLAVLPHALERAGQSDIHLIPTVILLGLLGFFLLEKLVLWRHCHSHECEAHGGASVASDRTSEATEAHTPSSHGHHASAAGHLILFGDAVHNFVDGVLIAAAFLTDVHLGIVTALAVAAHEIPQEVGDFAILLHSGFRRGRAFLYNVLSSLTTVIGGVLAYYFLSLAQPLLPYVLAVAASSFIYIAVADLIPGLHRRLEPRATLEQLVLIVAGVVTIYFAHATLH
jgi:zinc and cadmium transporter